MHNKYKTKEIQRLEHSLLNRYLNFSAAYMVVNNLHSLIQKTPDAADLSTITALTSVLETGAHLSQTKSLFLYREAADCLAVIPAFSSNKIIGDKALAGLKHIVSTRPETQHRAAAEALGALPVSINSPRVHHEDACPPDVADWDDFRSQCRIPKSTVPQKIGRSIVYKDQQNDGILIIKTDSSRESVPAFYNEAVWMAYLNQQQHMFPVRFEIPVPVRMNSGYVFKVHSPHLSSDTSAGKKYGIAFRCHPDYFRYPNELRPDRQLSEEEFQDVILNSALLLGRLSAMGIIHTAPIPLFHNRVQQQRRSDRGLYEWPRGGRLDQWLHSSRYPNFGVSGIRDFEHLAVIEDLPGKLYEHIGTHILSLVLVIGSYFRHKCPEVTGLDNHGNPVDLRYLFDADLFNHLLDQIFLYYFYGFSGHSFSGPLPCDTSFLVDSLIEEMGVDRHMEEILRYADRVEMTGKELDGFLCQRGFSRAEIDGIKQTREDIVMHTGPHLGRFNRRISVPPLIPYLETCSALCMWGNFHENRLHKPENTVIN